jgi:D-3-phosphoglycerate dehydrogenase
VPLNAETFHMIGEEQFDHMKKSSFFVNVCRGSVVDEPALIKALEQGKIRGAGLDVFEQEPCDPNNPLLQMENVITAPHMAGGSTRSAWLARQRASQQVAAVLKGDWPSAGQNPEVTSKLGEKRRMPGSEGKITGHI